MPVCIAGMHRSGTSMVANLLRLCGLRLGPEGDMLPPAFDNPEGFWEHLEFKRLNDELLAALGGTYDAPPPLPAGWHEREALTPLKEKARAVLRELTADDLSGWKDPRNSLTLPFWLSLVPRLKVVVCVRHPLDVARSERSRRERLYALGRTGVFSRPLYLGGWKLYDRVAGALSVRPRLVPSYRSCFSLWKIYNEQVLAYTGPENRLVTHYDSYFVDPVAELRRVLGFLGMSVPDALIEESCAAVAHGLRHNHAAARRSARARVPRDVAELYARLCEEARFVGRADDRAAARAR